jgi:hypothetical protein
VTTSTHEAPEPPDTLQDRFCDAIVPRTLLLGVGVLLLPGQPVAASTSAHEIEARQALPAGESSAVHVVHGRAALTLAASANMKRARQ